jgi:hypothetical protein
VAKIPFEKTILSAYRFGFVGLPSVIGVAWLPLLVFFALCAGIVVLAWPELHAIIDADIRTPVPGDEALQEKVRVLTLLLSAFARYACLIAFAACLAAAAAIWAADRYAGGIAGLIKVLAVTGALVSIAYLALRVLFFLPAVVVAEKRIGIGRAWELGGGNVLRMFGVLVAVLLPVAIVTGIASNIVFGALWWSDLNAAMESGRALTLNDLIAMFLDRLRLIWPVLLAFEIAYLALLTGLALGAVAHAYEAVTEQPA